MDFMVILGLAKKYIDEKIAKAELGEVELDTSLSKSGMAADSQAVGKAIEEAKKEHRKVSMNEDVLVIEYDK